MYALIDCNYSPPVRGQAATIGTSRTFDDMVCTVDYLTDIREILTVRI